MVSPTSLRMPRSVPFWRPGARGVVASGRHGDGQLAGNAELFDETQQRVAEIVESFVLGTAFAVSADTRAQLGVCAPDSVLVALDDDRHGDGTGYCHVADDSVDATLITRA